MHHRLAKFPASYHHDEISAARTSCSEHRIPSSRFRTQGILVEPGEHFQHLHGGSSYHPARSCASLPPLALSVKERIWAVKGGTLTVMDMGLNYSEGESLSVFCTHPASQRPPQWQPHPRFSPLWYPTICMSQPYYLTLIYPNFEPSTPYESPCSAAHVSPHHPRPRYPQAHQTDDATTLGH